MNQAIKYKNVQIIDSRNNYKIHTYSQINNHLYYTIFWIWKPQQHRGEKAAMM